MPKTCICILTGALLIVSPSIPATAGGANPGSKVVATVNGVAIKEEAVLAEVNKKLPLASFHASVSMQKLQMFRQEALQYLIDEELLYQEAKKRKLRVSRSELERQIELMKNGYSSERAFRQELAKTDLSYREWVTRVKRHLLIERIQQLEIIGKVVVTQNEVRDYYRQNKEKFIIPDRLKLRHILISVDPGAMGPGWQSELDKAREAYARIKAGEDFASVAREVSDDSSSRSQGGDIGWVHVGQLIDPLDGRVRSLKVGEVSQPIRSIYGFHIFKVEGRQPKKQLRFNEIDVATLRKKLQEKHIEQRRREFIASLKSRAEIRILDQ